VNGSSVRIGASGVLLAAAVIAALGLAAESVAELEPAENPPPVRSSLCTCAR